MLNGKPGYGEPNSTLNIQHLAFRLSLAIPPHAPPALRLRPLLDLAHSLAREVEDLADVAEGQLVVLQDAVAELEDGALFQGQAFDGLLDHALLGQVFEVFHAGRIDLGGHAGAEVAELGPV